MALLRKMALAKKTRTLMCDARLTLLELLAIFTAYNIRAYCIKIQLEINYSSATRTYIW